jgi:hypothetical protein
MAVHDRIRLTDQLRERAPMWRPLLFLAPFTKDAYLPITKSVKAIGRLRAGEGFA